MCYSIPGEVVEINQNKIKVSYFSEIRNAINEFNELKKGDFVYVQGGIVVDVINKKDALFVLDKWKEAFFELKEKDNKLSKTDEIKINNSIINKIKNNKALDNKEILELLKTENKNELEQLYKNANEIRHNSLGNSCCVHGIIEFSNYCRNNCLYCGIRKGNSKLKRYRMSIKEIIGAAEHAINKLGFKAIVLQSGEDEYYTEEKLIEIIKGIKEKGNALLFMSIGERRIETYKSLHNAGARGVLLRFETSNKGIYEKLRHGKKLEDRLNLLKELKKMGFIIATGFIIGLPGQSDADIMKDIFLTKALKPDMYSFGPLIPHPDTPLGNAKKTDIDKVLKAIAVARIADKESKILVTTALETLDKKEGRKKGLMAGANSLMINLTPEKYKQLYSIYPDKAGNEINAEENIKSTLELLYSLGRAPTDLGV